MNLRLETITRDSKEIQQIKELYEGAFPINERRPLKPLLEDKTGHGEILAIYDGSLFCGFVCQLTSGDICHIIYFAVDNKLRGMGYGTAALAELCKQMEGYRIIVDIEQENPEATNNVQRRKRKQFYINCGFADTGVECKWRSETYEILSFGGMISDDDFKNFWGSIYEDAEKLSIY